MLLVLLIPLTVTLRGRTTNPPVPTQLKITAPGYRGGVLQSSKVKNTDRFKTRGKAKSTKQRSTLKGQREKN